MAPAGTTIAVAVSLLGASGALVTWMVSVLKGGYVHFQSVTEVSSLELYRCARFALPVC